MTETDSAGSAPSSSLPATASVQKDLVALGGVTSRELAGRKAELDRLRAALEEARQERPSLILLTGDAGVGKTRLARELEAIAKDEGVHALHGQCLELSFGELPYAPIAAALRDADDAVLQAALADVPPDARQELARVFPGTVAAAAGDTAREDRFGQSRLFGWILVILGNLSRSCPVLLTIEDIHRADTSSRDFLRFLVQSLRSERLLAVATVRSDELHREHPVRTLVAELMRHESVARVQLRPLSEEAIYGQVEGILGSAPSPDLVRQLYARAEGNPFYTEELLAAGASDAGDLPATLQDALLLRTDKLRPPAREVLQLTAVAGRPVDDALIELVADLPQRDIEAALRECIDHNMLVCDRATGDYSVRHALLAEAVYGDLLPVERSSWHRRIAQALDHGASGDNAADRAHHWQMAGEPALALLASIEAGLAADRVFGYSEALAHFERSIDLWDQHPPGDGSTPLDLVALLARAAQAARWTGDSTRARDLCQRALEHLDHAADPLRAAELYERLGRYQPWDVDASLNAYGRAVALLPEPCTKQRMRLYVDEALALSFQCRWQDAREKATEAIKLAQGDHTLDAEGSARALLGIAIAFLGDPAVGEEHLREALSLAERAQSTEDLVQIYLDLGEVLRLEGRIEEAISVMLEGERVALRLGALPYRNFMAANAADDLFRLGRWDEVEERLAELARRDLDRPAELMMTSVAARLDTARGRLEQAADRFEAAVELCEALDLVEFVPTVYSGYAELELARARPGAARERISEGFAKLRNGDNLLHIPMLYSTAARVEADLVELAIARRDSAGATRAMEAAERHHDRLTKMLDTRQVAAKPPEANAHLAMCAAELTRAARQPSPARWQQAVALWQAHSNPYRVAYAAYRHADALVLSRAQRSQARAALDAAGALSAELGAVPLAADIQALAKRARLTSLSSPGGAAVTSEVEETNPYGLTERELEVLRLLGAGLTNREISQTLFISQHTAGVHVSHILGKLGVTNRVMAAAVGERLGLAPRE